MDTEILEVKQSGGTVDIKLTDDNLLSFEDIWLRDNCRCSKCYNWETFQRNIYVLDLPKAVISNINWTPTQLSITWHDGHVSEYKMEFLSRFEYARWSEAHRLRPVLWRGDDVAEKVARVDVRAFLDTAAGAKAVFQSLLDYGVAIVEQVSPTMEATEQVCRGISSVVQQTMYGDMWQFSSLPERADLAYSNSHLPQHHDNTYFTEAAGLQILHCIERGSEVGDGGRTTLIDGFYGATRLRDEYPEDYRFLTTFQLQAEYLEDEHHHKHSAPVISVDNKTGDLKQIRFNMSDRATMAFASADECRSHYRALKRLAAYYQNPEHQWQFTLHPGTVLIMDNFRVLHGRDAFSGHRVMAGCYISRSDWLDRARVLRLIE